MKRQNAETDRAFRILDICNELLNWILMIILVILFCYGTYGIGDSYMLEENAMRGNIHDLMPRLLKNKRELTRLRNYFEQIDDMAGQLQGNVRNYFDPERLQLLQLIGDRACRLQQVAQQSIDYCQTLRDFEQAQSDHKQNKTMQLMTVLTSVFFPLTVITGWYGMNFSHMPELDARFGYPLIIAISLGVIAIEFWILKKRKII